MLRTSLLFVPLLSLLCVSGCTIVEQHPSMSMQRGRESVVASLERSDVIAQWLQEQPSVAVLPMQTQEGNRATVGDPVLAAVEHWLVVHRATVIARDRQHQMICEIERQSGSAFDPRSTAKLGKQLGVQWFVTGTVTPVARYWNLRRNEHGRVDRSTIVVSIIEAQTSRVLWQDHLPLVDHASEERLFVDSSRDACAPAATGFPASDAAWELRTATMDAGFCPADDSVPRRATARITFANDGRVDRVELDEPLESSRTAECVKRRYRSARIPPFSGRSPTLLQRVVLTRSTARSP